MTQQQGSVGPSPVKFRDRETNSPTRPIVSPEDLLHISRLITVGELSACFAHEIMNPLMLIKGHIQFLKETLSAGDPLRSNFEVIERASERIEDLAKRMLDFSRRRNPKTKPCELAEVISDALRCVQPYLRTQFVDVQVYLESGLPLITLDRSQMIQALVNLLQNATDSMIGADPRVLSITSRTAHGVVQIEISDTGTGIAPADLPRIFEPFFTTKGERGTGLGLFIAKEVVEAHGGSITVETGTHGTIFVISLPL